MGKRLQPSVTNKISREVMSLNAASPKRGNNGNSNNNGNNNNARQNTANSGQSQRRKDDQQEWGNNKSRQKIFTKQQDVDQREGPLQRDNPAYNSNKQRGVANTQQEGPQPPKSKSARNARNKRKWDKDDRIAKEREAARKRREREGREQEERRRENEKAEASAQQRERDHQEMQQLEHSREATRKQERANEAARIQESHERQQRKEEFRRKEQAHQKQESHNRQLMSTRIQEDQQRQRHQEEQAARKAEALRLEKEKEAAREREESQRREQAARKKEALRLEQEREAARGREREAAREREREAAREREREVREREKEAAREREREECERKAALEREETFRREEEKEEKLRNVKDEQEVTVNDREERAISSEARQPSVSSDPVTREPSLQLIKEPELVIRPPVVRNFGIQNRVRKEMAQSLVELLMACKYLPEQDLFQKEKRKLPDRPIASDSDESCDSKKRLKRHKTDEISDQDTEVDLTFDEEMSNADSTHWECPFILQSTLNEAAISRAVERDDVPADMKSISWGPSSYLTTSWDFTLSDHDESYCGLFKATFLQPPPDQSSSELPTSLKGWCVPRSQCLNTVVNNMHKPGEHHVSITPTAFVGGKIINMLANLNRVILAPISSNSAYVLIVIPIATDGIDEEPKAVGYITTLEKISESRGDRQSGKKDIIVQLEGNLLVYVADDEKYDCSDVDDPRCIFKSKIPKKTKKSPSVLNLAGGGQIYAADGCGQFLNLMCMYYYVTFVTSASSAFAQECLEAMGIKYTNYTVVSLTDVHRYSLESDRVVPRVQKTLRNFIPLLFSLDDSPSIIADTSSSWPQDHESLLLSNLVHTDSDFWSPNLQNWTRVLQRLSRQQDKVLSTM